MGGLPAKATERAAAKLAQLRAAGQHVAVGPLAPQDAELVNSLWAYKSANSLQLVQQLITDRLTSCVRLEPESDATGAPSPAAASDASAPVAWVLQKNDGSIGMAHTLEAHRQQGLMSVCVADLTSRILQAGEQQEVFAFVVQSNIASQRMMEGVGFEVVGHTHWMGFKQAHQ